MLGTVMNGIMLRGVLKERGVEEVRLMTALPMTSVADRTSASRLAHLERGYMVLLAAGIGQPYVTTDYPAVQRAIELGAEAFLSPSTASTASTTATPATTRARRYERLRTPRRSRGTCG